VSEPGSGDPVPNDSGAVGGPGARERLLAGRNLKGEDLFAIFDELARSELKEDDLRALLRPHDDLAFTVGRDDRVMQTRLRLDEALGALTLLEIGRQVEVLTDDDLQMALRPSLRSLVATSEAFLRYANAYLYFGVRMLAGRYFPMDWETKPLPCERASELPNRRWFPIAVPPPPEAPVLCRQEDYTRFLEMQSNPAWEEALSFLDGFHDDPKRPDTPAKHDLDEIAQYELWLRRLLPVDRTDMNPDPIPSVDPAEARIQQEARRAARINAEYQNARFERISNQLVAWVDAHTEFYLRLQQRMAAGSGSCDQPLTLQPGGDEVINNPVAARFALAEIYWIARVLRAEVSANASVNYTRVSWIHLLRFRATLEGMYVQDARLKRSEETLRSVFDFVCDLVQNAVEVSDEQERYACNRQEYAKEEDVPRSTERWRAVFDKELREIDRQRSLRNYAISAYPPDRAEAPTERSAQFGWSERIINGRQPQNRIGLAFSGGGIRSATFNLGVLQGLQEFDLLRQVDYLSTVSGGGFIGAWLVGNVLRTRHWLGKATCWDESIAHLRSYASYLAPLTGLLSADTWTLAASWIRNTFLIQLSGLIWLFALLLSALLGRMLFIVVARQTIHAWVGLAALALALLVTVTLIYNFIANRVETGKRSPQASQVRWLAVLPSWVGSFLIAAMLWHDALGQIWKGDPAQHHAFSYILQHAAGMIAPLLAIHMVAMLLIGWFALKPNLPAAYIEPAREAEETLKADLDARAKQKKARQIAIRLKRAEHAGARVTVEAIAALEALRDEAKAAFEAAEWSRPCRMSFVRRLRTRAKLAFICAHPYWPRLWRSLWIGVLCLGVFYLAVCAILSLFLYWRGLGVGHYNSYAFVFGPALVLCAFILSVVIFIGLSGRNSSEAQREWWTRFGAWLMIYAALGLALAGVAIFGPEITRRVLGTAHSSIKWGSILTWAGTVIGGLFAGNSSKTAGDGSPGKKLGLELLARLGGMLFVVGAVIGAASALYFFLLNFATHDPAGTDYWKTLDDINDVRFVAVCVVVILIGLLFSWFFEINIFGLSQFYRNRLVRCYLGATRWAPGLRKPHPFTKFDFKDDMPLSSLKYQYRGPFPIFNCTLNLAGSSDLVLHSRHSASFTLTPLHCGSDRPKVGFAPTGGPTPRASMASFAGGVKLGQAVAVSGAAASPNMGYNTNPLVAFLLTMFNVRLGWWFPNPGQKRSWNKSGLSFSLYYLTKELLGTADETRLFLNVSDGGHFENLGVYELIRRRCKVIIACDAECDEVLQFGGLGNLVRICATDFGAVIDIDVKSIREQKEGYSLAHCAVGIIKYSNGSIGYLIYLKASVSGDEDVGVAQYRSVHPSFPHETTANQFFSEDQFESYRKLGRHVVRHSFRGNQPGSSALDVAVKLFDVSAPARTTGEAFLRHTQTLERMWEQFRKSPALHGFVDELMHIHPPIAVVPDTSGNPHQASEELCMALELTQLMEDVFMDLRLDDFWEHPDNRGWAIMFMRWARSPRFQRYWSQTRRTFGIRFEYFCQARLGLTRDIPIVRV
jgi:hypothetical protein